MIPNKKIFLTGTKGFLGKSFLQYYGRECIPYEYDRSFPIEEQLKEIQPDIIINFAAEIYNQEKMFESNLLLTQKILDYCKDNKVEHFLHVGSSSEYGAKDKAMSEKDCPSPRTIYESTKAAATMLCQGYARSYGVQVSIIRPFSVYGHLEKPHRLFPRLIRAFIKNEPMTLNNGYHDFIYIKDFLRGMNNVLLAEKEQSIGDIINLGSGMQYSNFQILCIFKKIFGSKAPITTLENFAKNFETEKWVCDTSYSRSKYSFSPKYSIKEGILDFIEEYKAHE